MLTKAPFVIVSRWKPAKGPKRAESCQLDQPAGAGTTQTELVPRTALWFGWRPTEWFQVRQLLVAGFHTSLAYASTLVCDTPRLCVGLRERPGLEGKRPGPELWDLRVGHFS